MTTEKARAYDDLIQKITAAGRDLDASRSRNRELELEVAGLRGDLEACEAKLRRILTTTEVADRLSLSNGAVTRALREGRIPGYKLLGVWRVSCAELEDWIESQRVDSRQSEPSDFMAEVHSIRERRASERPSSSVG